MKKLLAILLVVVMVVALAACNSGDDDSANTAPGGQDSTGQAPAQPPQSGTPEPPPPPPEVIDENFEIPYVDFGYVPSVDPFSRPTYQFAHIIMMHAPFTQLMVDMYAFLGTMLNFEITSYSSYRDADLFMNLIETNAGQGADGMIIEGDFTLQDRIFEITDELGIIYMPGLSPLITMDGKYLRPSAVMDSYRMGWGCMDYMLDSYERHTGIPFDAENIGFVTIEFGVITDFNARRDGAVDAYRARYSQYMNSNYFNLDTTPEPNPMAAEAGYNYVATTIAANPQFTGWLAFGVAEDFADGASRALEDMGYGGTSLVTCVATDMLGERWKTGYDGCWVAGADTPAIQWAHAIISGLMQLLEGQATPETLWTGLRGAGQDYTVIMLPFTMVNKAIYDDYKIAVERYTAALFT